MVAETVAKAPWKSTNGPFILIFEAKIVIPYFPSTYKIVLHVSTGVSIILNNPAVIEPPMDLTAIGRERV